MSAPTRTAEPATHEPVHAIVELPEPIRPVGYAERAPYKLTWAGGIHLLGGLLVVPGRTLNNPEDARAHAAAVLAAAARMEAGL